MTKGRIDRMSRRRHQTLYAIIRVDPECFTDDFRNRIKVTKVVMDQSFAEAEVARLNALNGDKDTIYFWQTTHADGAGFFGQT